MSQPAPTKNLLAPSSQTSASTQQQAATSSSSIPPTTKQPATVTMEVPAGTDNTPPTTTDAAQAAVVETWKLAGLNRKRAEYLATHGGVAEMNRIRLFEPSLEDPISGIPRRLLETDAPHPTNARLRGGDGEVEVDNDCGCVQWIWACFGATRRMHEIYEDHDEDNPYDDDLRDTIAFMI